MKPCHAILSPSQKPGTALKSPAAEAWIPTARTKACPATVVGRLAVLRGGEEEGCVVACKMIKKGMGFPEQFDMYVHASCFPQGVKGGGREAYGRLELSCRARSPPSRIRVNSFAGTTPWMPSRFRRYVRGVRYEYRIQRGQNQFPEGFFLSVSLLSPFSPGLRGAS